MNFAINYPQFFFSQKNSSLFFEEKNCPYNTLILTRKLKKRITFDDNDRKWGWGGVGA